jgi:alpha-soluble NSF attachment protein
MPKTAAELEKKAEGQRKGGLFSFSSQSSRDETAANTYNEAAAMYKRDSQFSEAGDAHCKAAELFAGADNSTEARAAYQSACTMFKRAGDTKKAINYFIILADLQELKDSQRHAAKSYEELADLYIERKQIKDAIQMYEKSASCYQSANSETTARGQIGKLAELAMQHEMWEKAKDAFEQTAQSTRGQKNFRQPDQLWNAMLCHMALEAKTTADIKESPEQLERYMNECPSLGQGSTATKVILLRAIFAAYETAATNLEQAVDDFESALADFKRTAHNLTPEQIKPLLVVKNQMMNPSVARAAGDSTQDAGAGAADYNEFD